MSQNIKRFCALQKETRYLLLLFKVFNLVDWLWGKLIAQNDLQSWREEYIVPRFVFWKDILAGRRARIAVFPHGRPIFQLNSSIPADCANEKNCVNRLMVPDPFYAYLRVVLYFFLKIYNLNNGFFPEFIFEYYGLLGFLPSGSDRCYSIAYSFCIFLHSSDKVCKY